MRGTPRQTNKALSEPILLMGAERPLVILSCFFWGWALMGIIPHWPMVIVIAGFVLNIYLLKFAAKRDPCGVGVFRANSRFLVQNRLYLARGHAGTLQKTRKIQTVPLSKLAKL
jgi:type IV secretory pathway TrbD component